MTWVDGLFVRRIRRQQHLAVLQRIQKLLRLLRRHLAGVSCVGLLVFSRLIIFFLLSGLLGLRLFLLLLFLFILRLLLLLL